MKWLLLIDFRELIVQISLLKDGQEFHEEDLRIKEASSLGRVFCGVDGAIVT